MSDSPMFEVSSLQEEMAIAVSTTPAIIDILFINK
jgi:hypothetical protein